MPALGPYDDTDASEVERRVQLAAGHGVDAFVYGFALQESSLPATAGAEMADLAQAMTAEMPVGEYPNLVEFTTEHVVRPGYDFGREFDFGLDLILDGLEAVAERQTATG